MILRSLGLSVVLALGLTAVALPAAAARKTAARGPQLRSGSMLVIDDQTDAVLLAHNAESAAPIASITKLMTALVVLEAGQPLDETLTVTGEDVEHGRGAYSRLLVGTRLTRGELMHLALMSSENRAAHALARNYPGGLAACIAAMNRKAAALGMHRTHFDDPTGLAAGNVASPGDLARLVNAAAAHPQIREYSTDTHQQVRVGRRLLEFRNTDTLVHDRSWDIVVQKTGYTRDAGRCLVLKARVGGRSLVMVLLDSYGKYSRFADARRIRRWLESQGALQAPASASTATPATVPAVMAAAGS